MGVIEEETPQNESGFTRRRNSRDKQNPRQGVKKKNIIKMGSVSKRKRSSISLTDLPSNVLVEILARLPLRTLFVARSVCKTLGFLSTPNPHFIKLHSSNAAQIIVFQFVISRTPSRLLRVADNELGYKNSQLIPPLFQLPKEGTDVLQYRAYFLVNACNGLLYFLRHGYKDLHSLVCNPVTSEYIIIPPIAFDPKMWLDMSLWLGFSSGTDQYKVLRIFCGRMNVGAQVYVIGSDSWRDIDDTLLRGRRFYRDLWQTQHVNGLMYWHYQTWPSVITFDFEREKFWEVALPPEFQDEQYIIKKHFTSIGVLGGCLCLSCNDVDANHVDLWLMRKCGNRESWTKDFVFDTVTLEKIGGPVWCQFKPLQFLGNGEILMQGNRNALVCYDPRTKTLRYFMLHRDDLRCKVVALTPSFVPLKDALKVDKVLTQLRPRGDEKDL